MRALVRGLVGIALFATLPGALAAQQGTQQTSQPGPAIPAPRGMVNDFANVIPPAQAARIEALVNDVRAKSGGEIAVVTMPDLGGRDVSEIALRIGREWKVGANTKIGDATRNAGIELTESFAMYPTAAVSGWYFSHPGSQYFVLGRVTKEQVEDYAKRKGWTLAEAERWLAPNLDYDPE